MFKSSQLNLGDLELAILECLWEYGEGDAKSVHTRLENSRNISSNTVQSALERLTRKDLLSRRKVSHAYVYTSACARSELMGRIIGSIVEDFSRGDAGPALAAFVDYAARADNTNLEELERMIERYKSNQNLVEDEA